MTTEETLSPPWATCFRLAMEAVSVGSWAISSVILNASGDVVSTGRNQLFDDRPSSSPYRNTLVSHAELNAIAALPPQYHADKRITLYTTVEPCPMCIGAIVMSPVRSLCIASRDPWAGSVSLLTSDRYMQSKNIKVTWEDGITTDVFLYLHTISQRLRFKDFSHPFYRALAAQYPDQFRNIDVLEGDSTFMAAFQAGDADAVLSRLVCLRQ